MMFDMRVDMSNSNLEEETALILANLADGWDHVTNCCQYSSLQTYHYFLTSVIVKRGTKCPHVTHGMIMTLGEAEESLVLVFMFWIKAVPRTPMSLSAHT